MSTQDNQSQEVDYLSMSDEELRNAPIPDFSQAQPDTEEDNSVEQGTEQESSVEPDNQEQEDTEVPQNTEQEDNADAEQKSADVIDFEAEYKRLLAPFKANGKEIQVKNIDDAISLMQMGANYNKKMAALKPNLKLMKMLENNGLLSEEKIGFLLDLQNKNPAAITKLIKDSGIDPLEIDTDKASEYKQTAYTVNEQELALDDVITDIQGTDAYTRTVDIVGNKWDAASKQVIAQTPQLLKVINDHVSNGIYDLISREIETERMFGRLNGMSDIEAYRKIGDDLHAKGAFNHLVQGSSQNQRQQQPSKVVPQQAVKPPVTDTLKDKKRAASSTKPISNSAPPADFNPLAMSDAEFAKHINSRYL